MLSIFNVDDVSMKYTYTHVQGHMYSGFVKAGLNCITFGLLSFVHSMTVDVVETAVCCAVYPFWSIIPEMGNYHVAI